MIIFTGKNRVPIISLNSAYLITLFLIYSKTF